jgi:uncharacterized protein YyaL (SSP411 family)
MGKFTNALIHESSPYLLQHAHNPVQWVTWSTEAFERAKTENKLVLISIGYSACHWCHVMEHECFEDEEVAALMNEHFIAIKVDREERPDVDQLYMTAVQLMTQKGGWPLNCFTLPDGRPIYGGTYFPKDQWMHILRSLQHTFDHDRPKAEEYAERLHEGIQQSEIISVPAHVDAFDPEKLHELVQRWSHQFDRMEGGESRAPKFPMPSNYLFLLQYAISFDHERIADHVNLTLHKMAQGGIYDQIGGGFARYSVDMLWKVPHFEKMLYDNGQLLSVYASMFAVTQNPSFARVIEQTIAWLAREMYTPEGCFYAAIDADSEGEEGKYYCWSASELERLIEEKDQWLKAYYSINQRGYWEDGKYILLRSMPDADFAHQHGFSLPALFEKVDQWNDRLLAERDQRIRPGIDNKCLTSWNAMTCQGLVDAFLSTGDEAHLFLALRVGRWINEKQYQSDGSLHRNYTNGASSITGFLDDYAHTIEAFISLYEATFDQDWLERAVELFDYTLVHFYDQQSGMFYYTSSDTELIARKMELNDNVLPSSNSVMAKNAWRLGHFYRNDAWISISRQQLANIYDGMERYGSGYSNWAQLLLWMTTTYYEVIILGESAKKIVRELRKNYIPGALFAGGSSVKLPIAADKSESDETTIYVCYKGTCLLPTTDVDEALRQMNVSRNKRVDEK